MHRPTVSSNSAKVEKQFLITFFLTYDTQTTGHSDDTHQVVQ